MASVHSFACEASYDAQGRVFPAGRIETYAYAGMLLFIADPVSPDIRDYDVYHTMSSVAMGPLGQEYRHLGKVGGVYPPETMPIPPQALIERMRQEVAIDDRLVEIRQLCGYSSPIFTIRAVPVQNGLELYVQTIGQAPPETYSVYAVESITNPHEWWQAWEYTYVDTGEVPAWRWSYPMLRAAL